MNIPDDVYNAADEAYFAAEGDDIRDRKDEPRGWRPKPEDIC